MKTNNKVVVVGLGEIGKPLFQLISEHREVFGVDISPAGRIDQVDVMHVCYPFQIKDFIGETLALPVDQRAEGTIATLAVCAWLGARVFRVHNVPAARAALTAVAELSAACPGSR